MNLNKAMIIGNLTRDPEIRNIASGSSVASFSVATSLIWTDQGGQKQEKTEFHNIVAWKRLAEICGQYLRKGSKVYVEGRLQTRDWTGQDGIKRYRTEIVAENLIMLGSNPGSANHSSGVPFPTEEPAMDAGEPMSEASAEEEIRIENIPF